MTKSRSVWRGLSAALALSVGFAVTSADAKDLVWTGGAGVAGTPILADNDWYYQVCVLTCWQPNWNGGSLTNQTDDYPIFQDRLLFQNNGASTTSTNNLSDRSIKQIVVAANAPSYTITGKAFTLAPTSEFSSVGIHKFGHNSTLTIKNDITLAGFGNAVDIRNDGIVRLEGQISGGSLTKTAGGTLELHEYNEYTGVTTIKAGKVLLAGSNAISLSSGVVLSGNGILETDTGQDYIGGILFQNINSLSGTDGQVRLGAFSELTVNSNHVGTKTFAGDVTGAGDFIKAGGGTLVLSGRNSNTGETRINSGTLRIGASDVLAETSLIRMSGGRLEFSSGVNELTGGLNGTGSVILNSGSTVGFGGDNRNAVFSGIISGAGNFEKIGTGQQSLRGNNIYTGSTSVRVGALRLDNDDVLADASAVSVETNGTLILSSNRTDTVGSLSGTGDVTIEAGSTLTVGADGTDTTFSGEINGDGSLGKTGAGTFTLTGNNMYTGSTSIDEGELRLANDNVLSDATAVAVYNGTLSLDANRSDTIGSLAGSGFVTLGTSSVLTTGADDSTTVFSGEISGDGAVTKTGSGEMTLSGTNTYTGPTTVAQGGLRLMGNNTLNPTSSLSIAGAGRLILDGDDSYELSPFNTAGTLQVETGSTFEAGVNDSVGGLDGNGTVNLTAGDRFTIGKGFWAGQITGEGTVVKTGINSLNLFGNNTFTGTLDVQRGSVALRNGDNLADGVNVTLSHNNAGLVLGPNTQDTIGSLSGSGIVQLSSGSTLTVGSFAPGVPLRTVFSGRIFGTGGFTQTGFKLIEMTGQNRYTGDTTLDNGNIQISNNDVISDSSDVVIESGSLRLSRGFADTVGSLSGGGGNVVIEDGAELSVGANNTSTTYSGSVRGDGALVKTGSGTMTLDGGGTLSVDDLTIAGGSVRLNGTGALEMSSITVNSGTSLNLLGRTRVDRVSADLVNNGFVAARSSGTVFDGDVSGSGDFFGRAIFTGSYGPGNSPALVQHQTTQFTSTHTLYMELGGLNRGSEYDAIDAFNVTLSGLLDVSLIDLNNGFSPMAGDTFDLIIANQIIGNFSSFSFAALADGLFWTTQLISSGSQMIYQLMVDGQVNATVPGPGALFLLLVGLAGIVMIRQINRSKLV